MGRNPPAPAVSLLDCSCRNAGVVGWWWCWRPSQVGADLYHLGVLMEEEHHQLLCSLMSGAHHSIALVLSWLLTCGTAH